MDLSIRNYGRSQTGGCAPNARTPMHSSQVQKTGGKSALKPGTFLAQRMLSTWGMDTTPSYQIDSKWTIVAANEAFCQAFRCSEGGLVGRDIRDLLRADWRLDFRTYVARALVGVGDSNVTLPMVAPCGEHGWYKHSLEPLMENGMLIGYRAAVTPHVVRKATPDNKWWQFRAPRTVWNFDTQPIASSESIAA